MRIDLRKSPTGVFDPLTGFRGRHGLHLSSPLFPVGGGSAVARYDLRFLHCNTHFLGAARSSCIHFIGWGVAGRQGPL